MRTKCYVLLAVTALLLSACGSEKVENLKSPCVGAEESPCGAKRTPVRNVG